MNSAMSKGSSKGKLWRTSDQEPVFRLCGNYLTGIISEDMHCFMENENSLPEEQKDCRRKSRGTKDQLLINKKILKDCRKRKPNLAMEWMDYGRVYDFVRHSWILECLDMVGIADNVRRFLEKTMKKWKLLLNLNGSDLIPLSLLRK